MNGNQTNVSATALSASESRITLGWVPYSLVAICVCLASTALPCSAEIAVPTEVPGTNVQVMLIKNALTALNHANLSGNYTVLRDLASPQFQQRYKSADLADLFRAFRDQNLDLSPVLASQPQLTQRPALSREGRLRLIGNCPTRPLAVNFDLYYQHVGGGWMIDEIAISLAAEQTVQAMRPVSQPQQQYQPQNQYQTPTYQGQQYPQSGQAQPQQAFRQQPSVYKQQPARY